MSVLVIDDNIVLASTVARSLARAGHSVPTAASLAQAREILEREPPQVICLDLQLPDGNGLDFLAALRRDGRNLPVVVISGHHSPENRARAKQLGAAGFLAKPFALSALHDLVAALLAGGRCRDAAEPPDRERGPRPAAVDAEPVPPRATGTGCNRPRAASFRPRNAGCGRACSGLKQVALAGTASADRHRRHARGPVVPGPGEPQRFSARQLRTAGGLGGTG